MKKYVLPTLFAIALVCNADAKPSKDKYKDSKGGTVYSVPDSGPTVALLSLSVALIALARRKFATTSRVT